MDKSKNILVRIKNQKKVGYLIIEGTENFEGDFQEAETLEGKKIIIPKFAKRQIDRELIDGDEDHEYFIITEEDIIFYKK